MRFILLMLTILFLSCENKNKNKKISYKDFSVSIPIKGTIPSNPGITQLIESDSGNYLFIYNGYNKSYNYLAFDSGKPVLEIPLTFDEKDGVRQISGGSLTSEDSIWNLASPSSIILINAKGEVQLKKEFINELNPVRYLTAFQHRALFKNGNKVYGTQPLFADHHNMKKEDIKSHQLFFSYDIDTDSVEWYDVFYPDGFWDNGKKLSEFSWAKRENKLYIAPWYDHQIQVFDLGTNKIIDRKEVKSNYVNSFLYVNELPENQTKGFIDRLIYDRYESLIYDKYRDVFYRIFLPGIEILEDFSMEKLKDLNWFRPDVGVMVLDSDLNILGEAVFKEYEIFGAYNYFVGEKGLYLSTNNVFNSNFDENHLNYKLIKFDISD